MKDLNSYKSKDYKNPNEGKIAVKRPCPNQEQQCFCTGVCQEVLYWIDKSQNPLTDAT